MADATICPHDIVDKTWIPAAVMQDIGHFKDGYEESICELLDLMKRHKSVLCFALNERRASTTAVEE
jgi:predicted HD phosphohydrolase